jgi:hypothetical protein
LRIALPIAALLLAAAVLAAVLLTESIGRIMSRVRETKPIGVLIGVAESSPPAAVQNSQTATPKAFGATVASQGGAGVSSASQPSANAAAVSNSAQVSSPDLQQTQTSNAQSQVAGPNASVASSPAAIAESSSSSADGTKLPSQPDGASQPATVSQSSSHAKKKTVASASQRRLGSARARMVGITSDGRLIYRTPSGRTTIVAPDSDQDEFLPRRHRRAMIDRDETFAPPPRFAPDYFPDD